MGQNLCWPVLFAWRSVCVQRIA